MVKSLNFAGEEMAVLWKGDWENVEKLQIATSHSRNNKNYKSNSEVHRSYSRQEDVQEEGHQNDNGVENLSMGRRKR